MKALLVAVLVPLVCGFSWAESQKTPSAAVPHQKSSSASFRQQQPTHFTTYPLNSVYGLTYQGSYPQLASYLQRPNARPSLGSRLRNFMNALFFRRNQAAQPFYSASLPVFSYKSPIGKPDIVQSKPILYSASASGPTGHKIHFPNFHGTKAYKNALSAAGSYPLPHAYLSGYTGKVYNNLYGASTGPDKSYGSKIYNSGYKA